MDMKDIVDNINIVDNKEKVMVILQKTHGFLKLVVDTSGYTMKA